MAGIGGSVSLQGRRYLLVFGLACLACRGGQQGAPGFVPHSAPQQDPLLVAPGDASRDVSLAQVSPLDRNQPQVTRLVLEIMRVDLPVGSIRHSRKVWNHTEPLRLDAGMRGQLTRNGLAAGVATREAWPALQAIFEASAGRWQKEELLAEGGLPVSINLGAVKDGEAVFAYGADRRLEGKTFGGGDKMLNVGYRLRPEWNTAVELAITLEVRNDRGVMTWEKENGIIRQVPAYERYTFRGVDLWATLGDGEYLVMGPSAEASSEYLVGSRFLECQEGEQRFETLLLLAPVVKPARLARSGGG